MESERAPKGGLGLPGPTERTCGPRFAAQEVDG
jgi:hypothetical protein